METGLVVMPQDFHVVGRTALPIPVDHRDAAGEAARRALLIMLLGGALIALSVPFLEQRDASTPVAPTG